LARNDHRSVLEPLNAIGTIMTLPVGAEDIEYRGYQLMVRQYGDHYRVFICPPGAKRAALPTIPHGADRGAIIEQAKAIVDTALHTGG
jgi:hypothetical protein